MSDELQHRTAVTAKLLGYRVTRRMGDYYQVVSPTDYVVLAFISDRPDEEMLGHYKVRYHLRENYGILLVEDKLM